MSRILLYVFISLMITFFFSCSENDISNPGNDENQAPTQNPDDNQNLDDKKLKILEVLGKYWETGYEEGDTTTYMKAFWEEDFQHVLDDDTIYDYDKEEKAADRVFDKFKNIKIEIDPAHKLLAAIKFTEGSAETEAELKTTYKIQFILRDNTSEECVYEGYYAQGENIFIFKFRSNDWRIAYWKDTADILD